MDDDTLQSFLDLKFGLKGRIGGRIGVRSSSTKKVESEGDPDWSPGSRRRSRGVLSTPKNRRPPRVVLSTADGYSQTSINSPEGYSDKRPLIQALPASVDVTELFVSAGWVIRVEEGNPIYVSPSGCVYKSLVKALDTLLPKESESGQRECGLSQLEEKKGGRRRNRSVGTSAEEGLLEFCNGSKSRERRRESSQLEEKKRIRRRTRSVGPREEESLAAIRNGSKSKERGRGSSRLEEKKRMRRRTRSVESSEEESLAAFRNGSKSRERGRGSSRLEEKKRMRRRTRSVGPSEDEVVGEFHNVEGREQSYSTDECVSSETKQMGFSNVVVSNNSEKCDADICQSEAVIGGRRPMHVDEKHVSFNQKLYAEMGNDEEQSSKLVSVLNGDLLSPKPESGKGEVQKQVNEEKAMMDKLTVLMKDECSNHQVFDSIHLDTELHGVRRSVRINGRHVPVDSELDVEVADSAYDFESSKPVDTIILENDKEVPQLPEKVRFREVHEVLASCTVEEKPMSCDSVEKFEQDVPQKSEPEEGNQKEALPIPGESVCLEVHEVLTYCMPDEKERSCTTDTSLSNEMETPDRSSVVVVNDDENRDGDMHQDGVILEVRRSTRITGRRVPLDRHMDIQMRVDYDLKEPFTTVIKSVSKKVTETIMVDKDKFEETPPRRGNMLQLQTSKQKFDCEKPRDQNQLDGYMHQDNVPNRCDAIKPPVSKKCSLSSKKNMSKSARTVKQSSSLINKRKSSSGGFSNGKKKKKRSGGCGLNVRRSGKGNCEENILDETKVNILSWLIDMGILVENEKVVCNTEYHKGNALRGLVTRGGIRCNCCKKVISLLEFVAHGGSNFCKPWKSICLVSGKSLMQCQIEAWEKEKIQRKIGFQMVESGDRDPSDDTCGICADGGDLVCCDGCLSTFHQDCLMLKSLPEGSWYCPLCRCSFCGLSDCEKDESPGEMELLSCHQCWCKYHRKCVLEKDMEYMGGLSLPYCGKSCEKVVSALSDLLGGSNAIDGTFSWTLLRHLDEAEGIDLDGRYLITRCNAKLALAQSVLHECFDSLVDPRTGIDMIAQAVYNCGSNFNRLSCDGFHCVVLEKDEEIISVATLRVHGTRLAEMPFIGTRPIYRRQGMCRLLLNAIEEMLTSMYVEKLILPAIPDMLETWTKSFPFKPLESSHKDEVRNLNLMVFNDTTLLQKPLYRKTANNARHRPSVSDDICAP
ncbi:hypothetical protein GIB67_042080 [Kingdonia uniflora]|uniref:PHD-type domain-containing protein n=1 Tax=Kingdonia uniflora TaxID=39325 RepID=A0A7J7MVN5_9MAGN|nr:hypothetical protein GIB67_042080 [Kingdonia uniflora]